MGRKTKIEGSRVWGSVSSSYTIKEACTTPMLYLTQTEKGKEEENRFGVNLHNRFFLLQVCFS